jgi:hypothetical protein
MLEHELSCQISANNSIAIKGAQVYDLSLAVIPAALILSLKETG